MSKKKWLRTALAAGVAAFMTAGVAATAIADPAPGTSDLVIHKYIGAPVNQANQNGEALDTSNWDGVIPANGVVFDIYAVGAPVNDAPPATPWPDAPPTGTYLVDSASDTLQVYNGATLVGVYALTATDSVTTGPNGTATSNLANGKYLVVENVAASTQVTDANTGVAATILQPAAPFIVMLPMPNVTNDGWLDVVHVYPKNEAITVDKIVDTQGAVAVGDIITYTITVSVPADIADSTQFNILDDLDPALDFVTNSIKVETVPKKTLSPILDAMPNYDKDKHQVQVWFSEAGRLKLDGVHTVIATFQTTVNASILDNPGYSVTNTANVEFMNKDGVVFEAKSNGGDESKIHTAAIEITKVDSAGQPLNGAAFKVATSQANAEAGNFLRIDAKQVLFDYGTPEWTTLGPDSDYTVSPDNVGAFTGLRDYLLVNDTKVWQTYWVVETTAPASYNALSAPIAVSFEDTFNKASDPADYDHVAQLTVTNSRGFILPETGGMGTILWTIGGVVLIGAAVLLATSVRRQGVSPQA